MTEEKTLEEYVSIKGILYRDYTFEIMIRKFLKRDGRIFKKYALSSAGIWKEVKEGEQYPDDCCIEPQLFIDPPERCHWCTNLAIYRCTIPDDTQVWSACETCYEKLKEQEHMTIVENIDVAKNQFWDQTYTNFHNHLDNIELEGVRQTP